MISRWSGACAAAAPRLRLVRDLPAAPAVQQGRPRGFAEVPATAASGGALAAEDGLGGWLRPRPASAPTPHLSQKDVQELCKTLPARRSKVSTGAALGAQLARDAVYVASDANIFDDDAEAPVSWADVLERLEDERMYLDELDSLLVVHSLIQKQTFDRKLFSRLVDEIERRYFSMELAMDEVHPALDLFINNGTYRSLVDNLPIDFKVRLVLLDQLERETGTERRRRPAKDRDAKAAWDTMDPVDMEEKEKQHFFKARIRVMNPRHQNVRVAKMQPGKRLRAVLAVQLMEAVPVAPLPVLAQIAQVTAFPGLRLLHGDLQADFQEAMAKRLLSFEVKEVQPYAVALAAGMASYVGPAGFQAWRRRLLPAVVALLKPEGLVQRLDAQGSLHPLLRGLPHHTSALRPAERQEAAEGLAGASGGGGATELDDQTVLRARLDRAAALLVAVCSARQVTVDAQLYDAMATPVKALLTQWMGPQEASEFADPAMRLPFELLADIAAASAASGVRDAELPALLARAVRASFEEDLASGRPSASAYAPTDVAGLAHFLAYGGAGGEVGAEASAALGLLWKASEPKLRDIQPHLALMLLDAMVRGAPMEMLEAGSLHGAVDELVVQRLDFDASTLGKLGH